MSRYRRALSLGRRFFAGAAVARLGVAMSGLAVFWTVRGSSGSFGQAGAATGVFAVAEALAGPQIGRLVDRWGQRRVMPVVTAVFAVAALLLIVACGRSGPAWSLIVPAAAVGASVPAVGALSAARWRRVATARGGDDSTRVQAGARSGEGAGN
ncbi:MFS transporter, partial [Actinoplanes philippinensis]|uniref:MFS transporter n=1 Tax=Actinoplanes philippinensis TaxID=35752 RepID=UPI0033D90B00